MLDQFMTGVFYGFGALLPAVLIGLAYEAGYKGFLHPNDNDIYKSDRETKKAIAISRLLKTTAYYLLIIGSLALLLVINKGDDFYWALLGMTVGVWLVPYWVGGAQKISDIGEGKIKRQNNDTRILKDARDKLWQENTKRGI